MSDPDYTEAQILKELGLDKLPAPRLPGLAAAPLNTGGLIKFKKAVSLVDPIETAAFSHYIPDGIVIDQQMDPRAFSPDNSRAIAIRTDLAIPSHPKITKATGITEAPSAHNHYLWLAIELERHVIELGAVACSPPLVFRTNGAEGTAPLIGLLFKLSFDEEDPLERGANWGLLSEKHVVAQSD